MSLKSAVTKDDIRRVLETGIEAEKAGQSNQALSQYEAILATGLNIPGIYTRIFNLKGFSMRNDPAVNEALFYNEAIPAMKRALAAGNLDQALELEALCYTGFVKQIETEEHYERGFKEWSPPLEQAGRGLGLPPLPLPGKDAGPLRIGFFFHNASLLAHTEVLLNYLEGLNKLPERPVIPFVYVFQSAGNRHNPEFDRRFTAVATSVHYLTDQLQRGTNTPFMRFTELRRLAAQHRLSAMTWVSLPLYLAFASGMGVAPLHVWYALRLHPNTFSYLDGRIGGGSLFRERGQICGQTWRTAFIAYKDVYDETLRPQAEAIRAQYAGKLILGSIGRPEKLMGPEYLGAVQRILQANPNAVFLWTTHKTATTHPPMVEEMRRLGIADRCHCIGWVDPRLWAQVFDIYLDSFPSVSGMTCVLTMAAATPVISLTYDSMLGAYAQPFMNGTEGTAEQQQAVRKIFHYAPGGDSLVTCADTPDEYVALAQKLIDDPDFRKAAGIAQQEFVTRYLCDQAGLAQRMNKHFMEIVEEAREKQ